MRLALTHCCILGALWAAPVAAQEAVPVPATSEPTASPVGPGRRVPSLERVLQLAAQRAPSVVVSQAAVESSQSGFVGARLAPLGNPYLEVVAGRGNQGATRDVSVQGTLWLPIEITGQRRSRIDEARALVSLRGAELGATRAEVAGAAVRSYGLAVVSAERVALLTEIGKHARTEADLFAARVDAGDATVRNAALAEVEAARSDLLLEETRADLVAALGQLSILVGEAYEAAPSAALEPPLVAPIVARSRGTAAPRARVAAAEAGYWSRVAERAGREGKSPLSVIVQGGRGDLGETRVGAGIGYAFPVFRAGQGERARAEGERRRATVARDLAHQVIARRVQAVERELTQLVRARTLLVDRAIPAAQRATDAAVELQQRGKEDLLTVIVSRRQLAELRLRRLDLAARAWALVAELVELTGVTP